MILKNIAFYTLTLLTIQINAHDNNKVILITGISQGLGLAIARTLAHHGYTVYGTIRSTSDMQHVDQVLSTTKNLIPLVMDVTDQKSITDGIHTMMEQTGRIDVLINNACHIIIGTAETCTIEEQQRVMDVNYFGVVRTIQAVVPIMRQQRSGHIINISSISGFEAFPMIESYVASKFALEGFSESLATYLPEWGIAVSLIEPAGIKTNITFTAHMGSRTTPDALLYQKFCIAWQHAMQAGYNTYQDPEEIAQLILSIIQTPRPSLRYQTNTISRDLATTRFHDPTGDNGIAAKRTNIRSMLALLHYSEHTYV